MNAMCGIDLLLRSFRAPCFCSNTQVFGRSGSLALGWAPAAFQVAMSLAAKNFCGLKRHVELTGTMVVNGHISRRISGDGHAQFYLRNPPPR